MKKVLIIILYIVLAVKTYSQQVPLYSQYNMNKFLLNPAVAGFEGYTTVCLVAHEQWIGIKGTPKTHSLTFDSRMFSESFISRKTSVRRRKMRGSISKRIGIGANLYNDRNGPIDRTGLNTSYSYHIDLEKHQLSFGLSLIFTQFTLRADELIFSDDQYDAVIHGKKLSLFVPDANFGAFLVTENYYAGYSTLQLLKSSLQFGKKGDGEYKSQRHHNLMFGYKYMVNYNLVIEPNFLVRIPETSRPQLDLSVKCNIKREYWCGLTFRTGASFIVFGGLKVDRYYFGYAFDYSFQSITKYTFGSHEFLAAVKFGETAKRYRWLNSY